MRLTPDTVSQPRGLAEDDSSRLASSSAAALTNSKVCWAVVGGPSSVSAIAPAAGMEGIISRRVCNAGAGEWAGGTNREAASMQWKIT